MTPKRRIGVAWATVPTDPFVPVTRDEVPRHRQNLPPGIAMPPSRSWFAQRPGDGSSSSDVDGRLMGRPGPNVGYALSLVERQRETWTLDPLEHGDDAAAVVAEVAMKRAARFGRAPAKPDVDLAVAIFGYDGSADAGWVVRRVALVHDAAHHYEVRRAAVDLVPDELLRVIPGNDRSVINTWRATTPANSVQ